MPNQPGGIDYPPDFIGPRVPAPRKCKVCGIGYLIEPRDEEAERDNLGYYHDLYGNEQADDNTGVGQPFETYKSPSTNF